MVVRPTARVCVVDAEGRILLFQVEGEARFSPGDHDAIPGPRLSWITPGGGLESGETFEDAACRELFEETGLLASPLGPCVHEQAWVRHGPDGDVEVRERFFLLRVTSTELSFDGQQPLERATIRSHRWWSLQDLMGTTETIFPVELPTVLQRILAVAETAEYRRSTHRS